MDDTVVPFIMLPSGVILNLAHITSFARRDLTSYVALTTGPASPNVTAEDIEALLATGLVHVLERPAKKGEELIINER